MTSLAEPIADTVALRWGAVSDPGLCRSENQDAYVARMPLFLVADGMGGHDAGREAAVLVATAFDDLGGEWVSTVALADATSRAAAAVHSLAVRTSGTPGSTVTGVALTWHQDAPCWLMFNIGDSRTYLVTDGAMEQVTVDHSRLQELRDHGVAEDEARQRVSSNVITRAIGGGKAGAPDLDQWLLPIRNGDRVLVCSDGLTGEVSDFLIEATLLATADPGDAAQALTDAALAAGGRDNVTAVVVDVVSLRGVEPATPVTEPAAIDTVTAVIEMPDSERTAPSADGKPETAR